MDLVEQCGYFLDLVDDGPAPIPALAKQRGPCRVVGEGVGLDQVDDAVGGGQEVVVDPVGLADLARSP